MPGGRALWVAKGSVLANAIAIGKNKKETHHYVAVIMGLWDI